MQLQQSLTKWIGLSFAILLAAAAHAQEAMTFKLDFNSPAGKIRRLNGTNLTSGRTSGIPTSRRRKESSHSLGL